MTRAGAIATGPTASETTAATATKTTARAMAVALRRPGTAPQAEAAMSVTAGPSLTRRRVGSPGARRQFRQGELRIDGGGEIARGMRRCADRN